VSVIAQLTGVSPTTVSKVLNGHPGVAADTRRRVETALREHGYRRPQITEPAAAIETVFYSLESDLAVQIMRGVQRVAIPNELAVGFTDANDPGENARSWSEQLLSRRPLGVITVHSRFALERHEQLAVSGIPLVAVDAMGEPDQAIPSVGATNWSGGVTAARHVIELGHRRIGVVSGPVVLLAARARLDACRAALDAVGCPLDEKLVRSGHFSPEDGLQMAAELLALPDPPTALLCGNDLQALGAYEAARRAGLRIPQDLSIVGFDDISSSRYAAPPLTTVRQPFEQMGETAATMLLTLAAGKTPPQMRFELATTLVVRGSTAPPGR
jgi:LacI family transcriptional regulator, xylobiose transport system transcriptional regulator